MSDWGMKTGLPTRTSEGMEVGEKPTRPEFPGRRSFVAVLLGVGTAPVGALLSVPLVRFVFFPILRRTTNTEWSDAGEVGKFVSITDPAEPVVTVKQADGWRMVISRKPVFVLPTGLGAHRVLSPVCPHLGCMVGSTEASLRSANPLSREIRFICAFSPVSALSLTSNQAND